uniref:MAM domain-containing protein n=1 Tax=Panagrolaimus sp. ES5 TaxID=591445 RepID=A0AC34F9K5_9BILA
MNAAVSPPKKFLLTLFIVAFVQVDTVMGCFGSVQNQLAALRKQLGGDIEIDFSTLNPLIKYPSILGQFKISFPCDLNCNSFDGLGTPICRWRNEWTTCSEMGDELDWIRARNSWGREEGLTIFGTEETATHCYILVGSQTALPPENAALLVSDPVQCQEGDGQLSFRFWTSPKTEIKVCIRKPGMGKFYDWCSCPITKGDPGPVTVIIPGSIMYTFEIVIQASHFDFNAFGVQGGMVVIDDIKYDAPAIYECRYIPHVDPPIPISEETCKTIFCTFDDGKCIERIRSSGWRLSDEPTGNLHTGIRMLQDKAFAYSKGIGTKTLKFGKFEMARQGLLEFCYYIAMKNTTLKIYTSFNGYNRSLAFESEEITLKPHFWICRQMVLHQGGYDELEFVAEDIRSGYAYIGLDSIRLVDPQTYQDMCAEQLSPPPTFTSSPSEADSFAFTTIPPSPFNISDGTDSANAVNAFSEETDSDNDNNFNGFNKKAAGSPVIKIKKLNINRKSATPFPEDFSEKEITTTPKDPFGFKPFGGVVYGRKKGLQELEELPEF